jgi:hypothetical protein
MFRAPSSTEHTALAIEPFDQAVDAVPVSVTVRIGALGQEK